MEMEVYQNTNKHKHPFSKLENFPMEEEKQTNKTYGAFLFDMDSRSGNLISYPLVIKNQQKASTNVKTSSLGVSFHNSKSFIPMQFSTKEYEMRAQRMLGSLNNPAPPDEMTYENPTKGKFATFLIKLINSPTDQVSNMFEKYAPDYEENKGKFIFILINF